MIRGPAEFARLQQGDVLVTFPTTEFFNTVLPLLGALVTPSGGLLSHATVPLPVATARRGSLGGRPHRPSPPGAATVHVPANPPECQGAVALRWSRGSGDRVHWVPATPLVPIGRKSPQTGPQTATDRTA